MAIFLDAEELGRLVRERRLQLRYRQSDLAAAARVGRQWLVQLEAGKGRPPLNLVLRVLRVLDCVLELVDLHSGKLPPLRPTPQEARISRSKDAQSQHVKLTNLQDEAQRGLALRQSDEPSKFLGGDYAVANFTLLDIIPGHLPFYQPDYRPILSSMVARVVEAEGPIFEDLLAHRITGAHGTRLSAKLHSVIAQFTKEYPSSQEGERKIIWPRNADRSSLPPFRDGSRELRDHEDIPLVELASLAASFLSRQRTADETIILMRKRLGLSSSRSSTRNRFADAIKLASSTIATAD